MKSEQRNTLAVHVARRLHDALTAAQDGDWIAAWSQLEDAHVLSQPLAGPHIRVHAAMWRLAWRTRKPGELWGQSIRVILAGPGSLTGRYPRGNPGRAGISAWSSMPIRPDLARLLDQTTASNIS